MENQKIDENHLNLNNFSLLVEKNIGLYTKFNYQFSQIVSKGKRRKLQRSAEIADLPQIYAHAFFDIWPWKRPYVACSWLLCACEQNKVPLWLSSLLAHLSYQTKRVLIVSSINVRKVLHMSTRDNFTINY